MYDDDIIIQEAYIPSNSESVDVKTDYSFKEKGETNENQKKFSKPHLAAKEKLHKTYKFDLKPKKKEVLVETKTKPKEKKIVKKENIHKKITKEIKMKIKKDFQLSSQRSDKMKKIEEKKEVQEKQSFSGRKETKFPAHQKSQSDFSVSQKSKGFFREKPRQINHKKKKFKLSNDTIKLISGIIILIALIAIAIYTTDKLLNKPEDVAIVNGEAITTKDLELAEKFISPEYLPYVTKEALLNQTILNKLLMQEAEKNNIDATDKDVDTFIKESLAEAGKTEKDFNAQLKEQNLTRNEINKFYKLQLSVQNLLDALYSDIIVNDSEVEKYYNENRDKIGNLTLENVSTPIKAALEQEKKKEAFYDYVDTLFNNADIKILIDLKEETQEKTEESNTESTATFSSEEVDKYLNCSNENGLNYGSVVFVYSESCPHCQRMKPIVTELSTSYNFKWASGADEESKKLLKSCFVDVLEGAVPQFICSKNGKSLLGEQPKEKLEAFAKACAENI